MATDKIRKYVLPNIPYLFIGWFCLKIGTAYRLAAGAGFGEKLLGLGQTIGTAFASFAPGLAPLDWLVGIVGAVGFRLLIYCKAKKAKKFRRDAEYGTARWGNEKDIKPFVDPKFENNMLLTATERLTMNTRPKNPANARNLNFCGIGSSGSGKTRFWLTPQLLQAHSSYVVVDPKGGVLGQVGSFLQKRGYKIKVFNSIDFSKSMHYNPLAYIKTEADILKFVNALISNTKGEGKEGDPFWTKAETLLYCALLGYIIFEGAEEDRNMNTLVDMISGMEVKEDDEDFLNAVDYMFKGLEQRKPNCFAVKQYKKYKLSSGKTAKSILISCVRVLQEKTCCFRNVVPTMKESVYKSFVSGDPHEEELLRQLIRGDIAGYEVLFHKYYPTFFAFIKGMTKETVVAEDIDAAAAIAKAYGYRYRAVTLDGQVVNAGGSLTGGSVNKNASILSRRGEIDALTAEAKKYAAQVEELETQLTELRREADTIRATVEGIAAEEKTAREDLISAQTLVSRLTASTEEAEQLNEQALREYDELTARVEELRKQKLTGGELVKKLTEEVARLNRMDVESTAAHTALTEAIEESARQVTDLQMEAITRRKDCEAAQSVIAQLENQQSGSEAALTELRQKQEQLQKENEAIRAEIEEITAGAAGGGSEIETLRRDIKEADGQKDTLEARRSILTRESSDAITKREAAASELVRLQEKSEAMQEQQNGISTKMWEEYELTRSEAAETAIPLEDVPAAQKRLTELRGRIRGLGAVNVAAIEEYEEVSGRYRFMKEQIDDAENAKKELTRLIAELSAKMSAIFTERFAGINRHFGEIFRELFGGGHAELRLTDATDPLETGIEIIVQPPGKIIKNLSALSGGEQAFVAICIYFAILRVNPAPFVLIDEIEAALDDVNVGKFAAYLHRMTDHTQFISITHRRGTMEQGDVLYGVTMEEEGISKLLRLDVAEMEKKFGKSLN